MENTQNTDYQVKPLTVYKASAGSGKTFTLAAEYIKLLIDRPRDFEKILAVTFTNKATEEMKSRILSQLYGIAHGLSDSKDYLDKICKELHLDENAVRKGAADALHQLLHHYNFFRVQTIDTFFQGVVRNLAKELALGNNMRVSLNNKQVISQAVDSMMETLTTNKSLMKWIEEYVDESMDEDKSWDITEEIKKFGANITKEFYKRNRGLLDSVFANPKFFDDYKRKLSAIARQLEDKYKEIGNAFLSSIERNGLSVSDFNRGGSGIAGYFTKLSNGNFCDPSADKPLVNTYVKQAVESTAKWGSSKTKKKDLIASLAESEYMELFYKSTENRAADSITYLSVKKTLQHMNKLRLLNAIEQEIDAINGKHSRFMLSDTQTMLYNMIKDDDKVAPFIFEKIGSRIEHIMIDEFQDTSNVQWKNFRILLEECMSKAVFGEDDERKVTNNLIVGDVKQSIYRFRSGDWRLLNNIDNPKTGFCQDTVYKTSLNTNFRSERNVIDFNNAFFIKAAEIEAKRIMPENEASALIEALKTEWAGEVQKAYGDVEQLIPSKRKLNGVVDICLFKDNPKNPDCAQENAERAMAYIHNTIRTLLQKKVEMKDIAILVRKNKDIPPIAEYFSKNAPEIKLVSEEAFQLVSSPAVNAIVAGMKFIAVPHDRANYAALAKFYVTYIKGEEYDEANLSDTQWINDNLPPLLSDAESMKRIATLPLSEMAETMLRQFQLDKIEGQTIYISTFFDKLNAFITDNSGILEEFLAYWEEEMQTKTVSVGNINGIRILSMHKSKGLEFDHVIIPGCNWRMIPPFAETLWCNVDEKPFSDLPFIPVEYMNANTLRGTIYDKYGSEEAMQEIVDHLNLLYVAFTRAKSGLYVVGDIKSGKSAKDYRATLIAEVLREIKLKDALFTDQSEDESDESPLTFRFGSFTKQEEEEKKTENVFLKKAENIGVMAHSFESDAVVFKQSNKSRDFSSDITDDDDSRRFIHNGTILHQVFSSIATIDDIERVLRDLEFAGIIYNEDTTSESLRQGLMKKFEKPEVREWFDGHWQVFNECNIIHIEDSGLVKEERPDRVVTDGKQTIVIDYKFGKPDDEHKRQVERYMDRLNKMGMPGVQGRIWYVNTNKVVNV